MKNPNQLKLSFLSPEEMAEILNQDDDYQVVRKFERVKYYHKYSGSNILKQNGQKLIGIFLDTETTGVCTINDKVIELALVPFEYTEDGKIYKVLDSYVSFQDPAIPIPEHITELTGITDSMVAGKSFNTIKINKLVESATIIVAHNAAFDKKFISKIFPIFSNKPWLCTASFIDWRKEGITSAKLDYLAYKFGFFYDAHRAEIDSLIGIHILAQSLPVSNQPVLKTLIENASLKNYRIWAQQSPFDKKDILKQRKYRWNDGTNAKPKSWYKVIKECEKDQELEFLYREIYGREVEVQIDSVSLSESLLC